MSIGANLDSIDLDLVESPVVIRIHPVGVACKGLYHSNFQSMRLKIVLDSHAHYRSPLV